MTSRFVRVMQKHKARVRERVARMETALLLMTLAHEQLKKADLLDGPVEHKRKVVKRRKRTNA